MRRREAGRNRDSPCGICSHVLGEGIRNGKDENSNGNGCIQIWNGLCAYFELSIHGSLSLIS